MTPKKRFKNIVNEVPPTNIPKDNKKGPEGLKLYKFNNFFFKIKDINLIICFK